MNEFSFDIHVRVARACSLVRYKMEQIQEVGVVGKLQTPLKYLSFSGGFGKSKPHNYSL